MTSKRKFRRARTTLHLASRKYKGAAAEFTILRLKTQVEKNKERLASTKLVMKQNSALRQTWINKFSRLRVVARFHG